MRVLRSYPTDSVASVSTVGSETFKQCPSLQEQLSHACDETDGMFCCVYIYTCPSLIQV